MKTLVHCHAHPCPPLRTTICLTHFGFHGDVLIPRAPQVIILIAPHFDEESVVGCLSDLRQQGISVSLMGVTSGLIVSERGLTLRPDTSLLVGERLVSAQRQTLIISGGVACATAVLSDPRSHQLVQKILQTGGFVAVLSWIDVLMVDLIRAEWLSRFMWQDGMETAVFVQRLITHIVA